MTEASTGDTLFSMGCGRLFEGSPAQMWELRFPRELRSDGKVQLATTLFVTQAIGDRVLTLSRPVMVGEDEARAKDYLAAVLGSLEVSAQPISVEQVQAKIQAGP